MNTQNQINTAQKKEIRELKKQINNLIGDNLALQLKISRLEDGKKQNISR